MILASLFLDALRFIPDHSGLLLDKSGQLSELAFTALGIALVIALPLGLWLGHRHRGLFLALAVSSLGRALPSIALIGLFIAWLGVGFWNNTVALVVLAIPPLLTNAYFAVDGVERDAVEAARGMGLTEAQILARVELPLGLPLLLAGVRIAAVFVVATATSRRHRRRRRPGRDHGQPGGVRELRRARRGVVRLRHRPSDGARAGARPARGLAPDGSEGLGSREGKLERRF